MVSIHLTRETWETSAWSLDISLPDNYFERMKLWTMRPNAEQEKWSHQVWLKTLAITSNWRKPKASWLLSSWFFTDGHCDEKKCGKIKNWKNWSIHSSRISVDLVEGLQDNFLIIFWQCHYSRRLILCSRRYATSQCGNRMRTKDILIINTCNNKNTQ